MLASLTEIHGVALKNYPLDFLQFSQQRLRISMQNLNY